MSKMWVRWGWTVVMFGGIAWGSHASADDIVDHLAASGNLRRTAASTIATKVSRAMAANASRGGNDYDRIRQAIGTALFGPSGAGSTLQEYNERLSEVMMKLERGLDYWALTALFGGDSIVNCRQDFGLANADCRALARAAVSVPAVDVDGLLAEARGAFQSGDYARAAEAYEQVTVARPDDAAAFAGLGQSRIRTRDGRGAVEALRTAIELAPNVANLRAYLGRALLAVGDRRAARQAFQEALSLNANHPDATAALRELDAVAPSPYRQAPVAQAPVPAPVQARAPARAPAPAPAPMSNVRTTVVASNVAPSTATAPRFGTPRFGTPAVAPMQPQQPVVAPPTSGGFGGARFGAVQATTVAPLPPVESPVQWVQKGDAHLQARQFPQALSAYNKAVAIDPNNAPAFAGIGVASMGAGDAAAATRALQTAVRLAPDSADYNAALGNALAATGETATATAAYRRALAIAPEHRAATAGLARIEGTAEAAAPATAAVVPPPSSRGRIATTAAPADAAPEADPTAEDVVAAPTPPPEPVAPAPTAEEDDLIAGLLSDPLGPTTARQRSGGGTRPATAAPRSSSGSAPPATSASGTQQQTPSREQVAAVMRDLLPIVKGCVPDRTGKIEVQITITGATGAVDDASVVGSAADDPEAICVAEVVRGAAFPPFAKEKLSIKYPFQL